MLLIVHRLHPVGAAAVEGSVRRIGDRVRIGVQVIDGETGSQAWGEKFERARRKPPSSLAAHECVQRGNAPRWDDPQAAAEAVRRFAQAIALDPGYARAYALLGTVRAEQYRSDPADSTGALDEAYALTKRSVELDDGDGACHPLLAHACLYRRSCELALQHMRRSMELNPNNAWNMAGMGLVLTYAGPAEDARTVGAAGRGHGGKIGYRRAERSPRWTRRAVHLT